MSFGSFFPLIILTPGVFAWLSSFGVYQRQKHLVFRSRCQGQSSLVKGLVFSSMSLVGIGVVVGDVVVLMVLLDMNLLNRVVSVRVSLVEGLVAFTLLSLLFFDVLDALGI